MNLECIVIEDEPLARSLIVDYVHRVDALHCVKECSNALIALDFLKVNPVEVVFLDLHLPKLKGLEFIRRLHYSPKIIITTAYHQYALESYEYPVIDYLVKPIEFIRFEQAIHKLKMFYQDVVGGKHRSSERPYTFIRVGNRELKIIFDEILYVESELEYLKIFRKNNDVVRVRHTMQSILKELSPLPLVRIHRSFLVAPDKVTSISSKAVGIADIHLPIGRQYRAEAHKLLRVP